MLLVSLFMIFKNTYVSSFGFYHFGRVRTGGILIILLILSTVFAIVKPSKLSKLLVLGVVAMMVLSLILGMHLRFRPMSILDAILILAPGIIGIGLILKEIFSIKDNK